MNFNNLAIASSGLGEGFTLSFKYILRQVINRSNKDLAKIAFCLTSGISH